MSDTTDADVAAAPLDAGTIGAAAGRTAWWRHILVILLLAALTRVGLYAAGLVGMLIMLTDLRRNQYSRLGGALVLGWWTFLWSRNGVPPLIGFALLALAAAGFAVAVGTQRDRPRAAAGNALSAIIVGALAVLNVAPYGLASPKIDKTDALRLAMAATRGDVRATHAQVVKTRERFDQRPVYIVVLFEPNAQTATTLDGEPCFRRGEVHYVDGITGAVNATRVFDRLVLAGDRYELAEARATDGNCLPLPRGTSSDVSRIPGR